MRKQIGEKGLLTDDNRITPSFDENGVSYRAQNPNRLRVLRYRIDGGMICDGKRCDFALGIPAVNAFYLIELKGCDLRKAVDQLLATLANLKQSLEHYTVHGRIVLSRIPRPDLRSSDIIRLERQLAGRSGTLKKACRMMEERF